MDKRNIKVWIPAFAGMTAKKIIGAGVGLLAPLLLSGLLYAAPAGTIAPATLQVKHLKNQSTAPLAKVKVPYTFDIIGDNRTGTDIYARLVKKIAADRPAFVINVGDTIWHSGSVQEWDRFVDLSAPLTMPYFIAPGNHEMWGKNGESSFKEFVRQPGNELYYSFKAGNSLFIILDTEERGKEARIAGAQLEWLKKTLAGSKEKFKFVFMHRPMYPTKNYGEHFEDSLNKYPEERDLLEAMFGQYGVNAVFVGHEHLYLRKKVGGIIHVITGGGGAPLYVPANKGGVNHYIRVKVTPGSVGFNVIGVDGNLLDSFTVTTKKASK